MMLDQAAIKSMASSVTANDDQPFLLRLSMSLLGLQFQVNRPSHLRVPHRCLELTALSSRYSAMVASFPHWCSYGRDIFGRRVLIGLNFLETSEFELLDAEPPIDEHGHILTWELDDKSFPPSQARWLELYRKHEAACATK